MKPSVLKRALQRQAPRLAALAITCAALGAQAQIPVSDLLSIANNIASQIETIAQWAQQLQQMQSQLQQAQQQFDAITGSRGLGNIFNNTSINSALPSDWSQVLATVKNTAAFATERQKYPTNPNRPRANDLYDTIAAQNTTMADYFTKSNSRLQQVQSLMGQINSASDPAAKQDLANRMLSEANVVQANAQIIQTLQAKQKQDLEAAGAAARKEWRCNEFKISGC